uniref:Helicase ATP-binding domain-containing protein n=1 Tax=Macrostomum lignano TaxID=282301 RepID=A0A1I8G3F4_9PLAT
EDSCWYENCNREDSCWYENCNREDSCWYENCNREDSCWYENCNREDSCWYENCNREDSCGMRTATEKTPVGMRTATEKTPVEERSATDKKIAVLKTDTDQSQSLVPNSTRREFDFPFEPYPIQLQLMRRLHATLSGGQRAGIFESPTGTGKSLSLLCACLTWLNEEYERQKLSLSSLTAELNPDSVESSSTASPDAWIAEFAAKRQRQRQNDAERAKLEAREKALQKLEKIRSGESDEEADLEDRIDEEIDSVEESTAVEPTKILFASRTHSQLSQIRKEFSRTVHANKLSAVSLAARNCLCVNSDVTALGASALINERCLELRRKSSGNKAEPGKENRGDKSPPAKRARVAKDDGGCGGGGGCPYYRRSAIDSLAREALRGPPLDIEDLARLGRERRACPYYAARRAAPLAQLLLLPYQTLLHRGTRAATGLNLRGHVLVIDEAHNLLETLAGVHSVCLTVGHLRLAVDQLAEYEARYLSRLAPQNLLMVRRARLVAKQLLAAVDGDVSKTAARTSCSTVVSSGSPDQSLAFAKGTPSSKVGTSCSKIGTYDSKIGIFGSKVGTSGSKVGASGSNIGTSGSKVGISGSKVGAFGLNIGTSGSKVGISGSKVGASGSNIGTSSSSTTADSTCVKVFGVTEFHLHCGIDNVDVPDLLRRLKEARLSRKVGDGGAGGSKKGVVVGGGSGSGEGKQAPLLQMQAFLSALLSADDDGRVLLQPGAHLKYLLLNPASHFAEVVQQSRCVILAGGTMRPVDDLITQLFVPAGCSQVEQFSCGHVVDKRNVLALVVDRYDSSSNAGHQLCFTQSAKNQPDLLTAAGDALVDLLSAVPSGAVVFFPSHDWESAVHSRWQSDGRLARLCHRKRLFYHRWSCPVGGRLSEGINFADDFGRCVVMLGMPYPNKGSPELIETMAYLSDRFGPNAGRAHYESLCMRAVNQCIGRAIRHKSDYAAIVLLDSRYSRPAVRAKLPDWIGQSLLPRPLNSSLAVKTLTEFFAAKQAESV